MTVNKRCRIQLQCRKIVELPGELKAQIGELQRRACNACGGMDVSRRDGRGGGSKGMGTQAGGQDTKKQPNRIRQLRSSKANRGGSQSRARIEWSRTSGRKD
jgi:50S ribosomal subunit-associated GTPase HflX